MTIYSTKFKLVNHLITFPVYVNNRGPFDFWLDTGGPSLIISKNLAEELGLDMIDTGKRGVGAGGEVPVIIARVSSFKFAGLEFNDLDTLIIDLRGMEERFNFKFYGCVGYDILKDYKVCIDYPRQELILLKE